MKEYAELYIYDKEFNLLGIIDKYISLIWTDRYCGCGDFELFIPCTTEMLDLLQTDRYVEINHSDSTMIIEGVQIQTNPEEGDRLTITGRSLECLLSRRTFTAQTVVEGDLPSGIKKLLDANIINPTESFRKIENFIFVNTYDSRIYQKGLYAQYEMGDNLYDAIYDIFNMYEFGFDVKRNALNQFEFSMRCGDVRTRDQQKFPWVVMSSEYETLLDSNHAEDIKNYKNHITVYGQEMPPQLGLGTGKFKVTYDRATDGYDYSQHGIVFNPPEMNLILPKDVPITPEEQEEMDKYDLGVQEIFRRNKAERMNAYERETHDIDVEIAYTRYVRQIVDDARQGKWIINSTGTDLRDTIYESDLTVVLEEYPQEPIEPYTEEQYTNYMKKWSAVQTRNMEKVQKYLDVLYEEAKRELIKCDPEVAFDGELNEFSIFHYKEDFFIGDILEIENDYGMVGSTRVTEYIYSWDQNGSKFYPTLTKLNGYGVYTNN